MQHPQNLLFKSVIPWMVILLLIFLFFFMHRSRQIALTPEALLESASVFQNPYQGFYRIVPYILSDSVPEKKDTVPDYDLPLVLLEINLCQFPTGPISDAALSQLEAILDGWSQTDSQILLRFLYDWNGVARTTEPDSLSIILNHMDQVSEIVNRYESSVYLMQGAFVGNWGEMHGSQFTDTQSLQTLIQHLHQVISPSIYLSVRTPAQWRMVTGLYDIPERFPAFQEQATLISRLGLYNDGMLGSLSDLGTYGNTPRKKASTPAYKGTREEEMAFQDNLCQYVPNGGEVVYSTPYNDLTAAVPYLNALHISYLNADYDPAVLQKWQKSTWKGHDAFYDCDGLTYVKAHLGYRYTARKFTMERRGFLSKHLDLHLTVQNVGFGNSLKSFDAAFLLQNTATGETLRLPLSFDFRTLKSGQTQALTASLPAADLPEGSYQIFLSVTDHATGKEIQLANTSYLEGVGLLLGQLDP